MVAHTVVKSIPTLADLTALDRKFAKTNSRDQIVSALALKLEAAIRVWDSREYREGEWKESNEKHRESQIETLASLLKQVNKRGFLTKGQIELADKLIDNARSLDRCLFNDFINSSSNFSSTQIESKSNLQPTQQPIERIVENMSTTLPATEIAAAAPPVVKTNGSPAASAKKSLLPTKKSPPKKDFSRLTILIYGQPKIGKSSLAANADNALFIETEDGLGQLEVFKCSVTTWRDFLEICAELAEGKHSFSTVVIDTIDNLYQWCREFVFEKLRADDKSGKMILHESDAGYGKGYDMVANEFRRALTKLSLLPYGLIALSHSKTEEIETRTGKVKKTYPSLPKQGRDVFLGMADLILFMDIEKKDAAFTRVIRTKPALNYEAGSRAGALVDPIELAKDPKESFAIFRAAYEAAKEAI